jgi:hypothetical protein
MLIDKYLRKYDFAMHCSTELGHAISPYEKMLRCDFSKNRLIKFLLTLRGISTDFKSIEQLPDAGFVKLDEAPGTEIVFGIITNSAMFNSCCPAVSPADFVSESYSSAIKAVVNFQVQCKPGAKHILSTETRVYCGSKKNRFGFGLYWLLIKPFSYLLRRTLLYEIKRQASGN